MIGRTRPAPGLLWAAGTIAVLLVFAILGAVASAVAPAPSGPALSSYATSSKGLAAWAALLERDGHRVTQIRGAIQQAHLPGNGTLIVLGNEQALSALSDADGRAIKRFLDRDGRLVVAGHSQAAVAGGTGRVIALTQTGFLENRNLGRGDNAYRALALAGSPSRPVFFDEVVHGYGPAGGLAALPTRWWFAFALLALALGAWALSRGMRLGGSDPVGPAHASPRAAYVDAMAQTLVRTESRDALLARVDAMSSKERMFGGSLEMSAARGVE